MINKSGRGYYATHQSKSSELSLLQAAKSENALTARLAKNQLIKDNEGFLRDMTCKLLGKNSFMDFESTLQDTRRAFLAAIENYNLSFDVSIRAYAKFHLMQLRRKI